jgi:DNA-binding XRE family transcriptional regulator
LHQKADVLENAVVRQDQGQAFEGNATQQSKGCRAIHLFSPHSIACSKNPELGYSKTGCTFARVSRGLHPTYKKLSSLLAEARAAAGLTQAQVAERLKRPQSFVSKYENGERQLDVVEFIAVCKAIGVSAPELIGRIA